jgi:hypothetical protein
VNSMAGSAPLHIAAVVDAVKLGRIGGPRSWGSVVANPTSCSMLPDSNLVRCRILARAAARHQVSEGFLQQPGVSNCIPVEVSCALRSNIVAGRRTGW